jgi:tetratricopeptide (TPR) repeat protein
LRAEIGPDVKLRIESQPTTNTEAYNLFLLAEQVWETDANHALDLYEQVIQKDPEFATVYARIGSIKRGLDYNPDAVEAVEIAKPYYEKALEIDPENYDAHLVKGQSHLWYEWDFEKADQEYQFLKLHYPNSFILPALLLSSGRFKEALENSKRNIKTDPLNPFTIGHYLHSLYYNGQKEQLLEEIPNALLMAEGNQINKPWLFNRIAEIYQFLGMYQESLQICENYLGDDNSFRRQAIQAINFLHLQQPNKAKEILQKMKLLAAESGQDNTSIYIALIYAQLEDNDLAFEWLEKAYLDHEVQMYWLKVYPSFKPLYSDPRWQRMLDKVGFPE